MYAKLRIFAVVLVVVVSLFSVGLVAMSGAATAADDIERVDEEDEEEPDPREVADQLHDLVIVEYEYEDGEFIIVAEWQGGAPTTLTLTEMIELDSGGSTEISFQEVRLEPGEETEISMQAEQRAGGTAAVLLTTPQSIDEGDALVLQAGEPTEYPAIRFQNVLLAIGISSVGAAGLSFVFVLRRKHEEEHGKERIA